MTIYGRHTHNTLTQDEPTSKVAKATAKPTTKRSDTEGLIETQRGVQRLLFLIYMLASGLLVGVSLLHTFLMDNVSMSLYSSMYIKWGEGSREIYFFMLSYTTPYAFWRFAQVRYTEILYHTTPLTH